MPSCTSSSEVRAASRAIAVLLAGILVYAAGLEIVTRRGFSRVSRTQRRIHQDLSAAKSIAPPVSNDPPAILVVGNSLLLDGVDRASLKKELAPNYLLALLPIENTQFEDWYFGLRRLFAEGSRPSIVVVCLSTRQMMSRATDGEYFAHYLMQERDLLALFSWKNSTDAADGTSCCRRPAAPARIGPALQSKRCPSRCRCPSHA